MSLLDNMPHTVDILRPTYRRTAGDVGELQDNVPFKTNLNAWVQNRSRGELVEFQKRDHIVTDYVFFHADPELRIGDRIQVTAGPDRIGDILMVLGFRERSAGKGVLFGAICELER